jgi:hypothetical protein
MVHVFMGKVFAPPALLSISADIRSAKALPARVFSTKKSGIGGSLSLPGREALRRVPGQDGGQDGE